MQKKIPVGKAAIGMFFVRPEGSWFQHGMWSGRFLIRDAEQLATVRACGVAEVWIDTDKGDDVGCTHASADRANLPDSSPQPTAPAQVGLIDAPSAQPPAGPAIVRQGPPSVHDELPRAREVLGEVRSIVQETLGRAHRGEPPDVEACRTVVAPMVESVVRNAAAMTTLIRLRDQDDYSFMHSVSVSVLMVVLGRELGMDSSQWLKLGVAGLLHDVGKAMVPAELLTKPGRLTDEEFARVREHPRRGHALLRSGGLSEIESLEVCLHHHERVDGGGYPDRLGVDNLSAWARMGAICDVYDAVTSDRSYKKAWDPAYSLAQMASWKGQFDRGMLAAFIRAVGVYPVGSLVRLSSGKLAIVIDCSPGQARTPIVRIFWCTRMREPVQPRLVDLSKAGADTIVAVEPRENWANLDLSRLLDLERVA